MRMLAVATPDNDVPSTSVIDRLRLQEIQNSDGSIVRFGSVLDGECASVKRILVIFIRHFFCGNCQEYIRRICDVLPPQKLNKDLNLVIIGCGASSLIQSYIQLTGCPYKIYADPSAQIYHLLSMRRTLSLGNKSPDYIQHSLISGALKSVKQGLKRVKSGDVLLAGDLSINGGEFLFTRTDGGSNESSRSNCGWTVSWCHRMNNSRDHTELEVLRRTIGLEAETASTLNPTKPLQRTRTQILRRSLSQRGQMMMQGISRASSTKLKVNKSSLNPPTISVKAYNKSSHTAFVHIIAT